MLANERSFVTEAIYLAALKYSVSAQNESQLNCVLAQLILINDSLKYMFERERIAH